MRMERSWVSRRDGSSMGIGRLDASRGEDRAMIVPLARARWTVERDDKRTRRRVEPGRETIPLSHSGSASAGVPRMKGRSPLNEDQRRLASRYMPLASSLAGRIARYWPAQRDELESTAFMALVEAAGSFDPERKVGFATFARYRIRGALRDYQRSRDSTGSRGDRQDAPVFQRLGKDAEQYGQVIGIKPDQPVGTDIEAVDAVEDWLSRLPKTHAAACRLIYVEGKSQDEAAALVGCSKSYLSRLHREAITWLVHEARAARGESAPPAVDEADH